MLHLPDYHNPIGKYDYLSIQHVERYRFCITQLSPGQRVLDVACGAGYGTVMLSEYGYEAIGADYNEKLILRACNALNYNNFVNSDAHNLPFQDESFDAVVSFETIEHVYDGRNFLSQMFRVLRPGGFFICSTPNIRYTAHPLYHVKEYEPEEFYTLIEERFVKIKRYGQYFKTLDRLQDLFRWNIHDRLAAISEKLGVKEMLKAFFERNAPIKGGAANIHNLSRNSAFAEALWGNSSNYYMVRPYIGPKWLRILVAVARKKASI
jgi:ubiquinone/menaquinone biosynthesis C-methylase UbiE